MKYVKLNTTDGPMILMLNWITHIVPEDDGAAAAVYLGSGLSHLHHGPSTDLIDAITQTLDRNTP